MTVEDKQSMADIIRQDFDDTISYLMDGEEKVSFSSDKILTDLVSSEVSALDAIDILYEARQYIQTGMSLHQIAKILNKIIRKKGYPSSAEIRGRFNPLIIEYRDYEEILTFKILKQIVEEELMSFEYSSSTGKAIVEELYRILKSIKTNRFRQDQVRKIIPSVIRSILDVDPFDIQTALQDLYTSFIRKTDDFEKQWTILPEHEKDSLIVDAFLLIARIFLLTHQNLPGHNVQSTISQVNSLISDINSQINSQLESKEIYLIGKAASSVLDIHRKRSSVAKADLNWYRVLPDLSDLISRMVHQKVIKWIIITDQHDREIYIQYLAEHSPHQNLIAMALSGVQKLIKEVTSDNIRLIEQDDGYIYLEKTDLFTAFFFIKSKVTDFLRTQIKLFVEEVQSSQKENIENFNGSIKDLKQGIDGIASEYLRLMI